MDLGTANTIIISDDKIVVDEPSVVALDRRTGKMIAVGEKAKMMYEKTHDNIRTIRPLRDGVIADFTACEQMMRGLIKMVHTGSRLFSPTLRMVIGVPSGSTEVELRAERIKIHVGSALTDLGDEAPEDYVVHGPNRITALPMEVPVCYQEIAHCLDKTVAKIENAVLSALEATPPELYADIVKNGIWLTGGGALLRGLDKRLQDKISIPFHIAEDPLHSVAKGAGIALKNVDRFSFLMR